MPQMPRRSAHRRETILLFGIDSWLSYLRGATRPPAAEGDCSFPIEKNTAPALSIFRKTRQVFGRKKLPVCAAGHSPASIQIRVYCTTPFDALQQKIGYFAAFCAGKCCRPRNTADGSLFFMRSLQLLKTGAGGIVAVRNGLRDGGGAVFEDLQLQLPRVLPLFLVDLRGSARLASSMLKPGLPAPLACKPMRTSAE